MPKITFVEHDDTRHEVESVAGTTLMQSAVAHMVPGIDAECGGACACATCHVYIDEAFLPLLSEIDPTEEDMLDFAHEPQDNSRLACQVALTDAMDGMIVRIPESQG